MRAMGGAQRFHGDRRDLLLNASLIREVLSAGTEGYDRGDRFALCRTAPSLREYLPVAQHPIRVDLYTRGDAGNWLLTSFGRSSDEITLPGFACALTLADIYDKIEFHTA